MEIRIKVPRMPHGLAANLLALAGLVAVALAAGGLTENWWWSVLLGGLFAVGVAYVITTQEAEPAPAAPIRTVEMNGNGHNAALAAEIAKDAAFMRGQAS